MMNAHVIDYYLHIWSTTKINSASDAWLVWYAMARHRIERKAA